jgi:hypothetical protein
MLRTTTLAQAAALKLADVFPPTTLVGRCRTCSNERERASRLQATDDRARLRGGWHGPTG